MKDILPRKRSIIFKSTTTLVNQIKKRLEDDDSHQCRIPPEIARFKYKGDTIKIISSHTNRGKILWSIMRLFKIWEYRLARQNTLSDKERDFISSVNDPSNHYEPVELFPKNLIIFPLTVEQAYLVHDLNTKMKNVIDGPSRSGKTFLTLLTHAWWYKQELSPGIVIVNPRFKLNKKGDWTTRTKNIIRGYDSIIESVLGPNTQPNITYMTVDGLKEIRFNICDIILDDAHEMAPNDITVIVANPGLTTITICGNKEADLLDGSENQFYQFLSLMKRVKSVTVLTESIYFHNRNERHLNGSVSCPDRL